MRDLLTHPLCHAEDLGLPIPPSPYAVSVCLPLWEHVIGYEEGDPNVVSKFQSGYPRFFVPPSIQALMAAAEQEHCGPGQRALVFPRPIHAERCAQFIKRGAGTEARVAEFGADRLG